MMNLTTNQSTLTRTFDCHAIGELVTPPRVIQYCYTEIPFFGRVYLKNPNFFAKLLADKVYIFYSDDTIKEA
jgi:hypothetical protein